MVKHQSAFDQYEFAAKAIANAFEDSQKVEEEKFQSDQDAYNMKIENLRRSWLDGDPSAVEEHASIVLEASAYGDFIQKDFDTQFLCERRLLVVEYRLPSIDSLPLTKSVRFVASTGELKQTKISAAETKALFEDVCYQLCLRTIHELFEADTPNHFDQIVFNGIAEFVDRSTGKDVAATILTLRVGREEFNSINLSGVDPKACFRNLKGISAANLIGLAPVPPILNIDKADRRFVEARGANVADDGSTNLAAMDWEEFEHLVHELFEKEFMARGGEVKITRSSRDGGVDAVAFDPDPIGGGKIVIQAKRYTRTVGVASVRDLFGATINEGANKGILVTTSDFGPDAYQFAAGKPLTLLTGANLLHLLEKHGFKAKIDLADARRQLGLSE